MEGAEHPKAQRLPESGGADPSLAWSQGHVLDLLMGSVTNLLLLISDSFVLISLPLIHSVKVVAMGKPTTQRSGLYSRLIYCNEATEPLFAH